MLSEARKRANAKWNSENLAKQTVTVRKETLAAFKATCAANGDKVNTVLREAMEKYIADHGGAVPQPAEEP